MDRINSKAKKNEKHENNGRSPETMKKLGSIPRTPTLKVLAARSRTSRFVLSMLSVGELMLWFPMRFPMFLLRDLMLWFPMWFPIALVSSSGSALSSFHCFNVAVCARLRRDPSVDREAGTQRDDADAPRPCVRRCAACMGWAMVGLDARSCAQVFAKVTRLFGEGAHLESAWPPF